jgi:uncharacterized protein
VILIDANVFMYAAGADHANKLPSMKLLRGVAQGEIEAAIDAEVLQEILHRYRSIGRWADGRAVFSLARRIVPLVLPITAEILDQARDLMDLHQGLSARDALHAAVALHSGAQAICSYDRDFDPIEELQRIEPKA